jgi:small-conductance mechanosensitive channel
MGRLGSISLFLLAVLCALAPPAFAAPRRSPAQAAAEHPSELSLAGRTVFTFRATRHGYSPEQRHTAAEAMIEQVLEQEGEGSVSRRDGDDEVLILVGERQVFAVLADDVDSLAGETLETLADRSVERLAQALGEVREARGLRGWLVALGRSAVTLLIAALLLYALLRNQRRMSAWFGRVAEQKSEKLRSTDLRVLGQQNLVPLARSCAALLSWVLAALVVFLAVQRLLLYFPYSRPVGEHLESELLTQIRTLALALVQSLPGIAVVIFIWLCARFGVGVVRRYFQAAAKGLVHSHLAEAVTPPVAERIVGAFVWLIALVVAFPYIPGSSSGAFQGVTVLAGLMVSLGSTSLVGQVASGLVLAYSRAFRVGDMVRFGDYEGTVVAFGLLATKIKTPRNEEVNVPNAVFTAATTVNYTRYNVEAGTFLATKLTLGYDIPWRKVHELLIGAARRTDGVRADPPPHVLQTALSDFYIEYELRAVGVDPNERPAALSRLLANVLDDFDAAGVQILSPHHTHLHGEVRSAPPSPHAKA